MYKLHIFAEVLYGWPPIGTGFIGIMPDGLSVAHHVKALKGTATPWTSSFLTTMWLKEDVTDSRGNERNILDNIIINASIN